MKNKEDIKRRLEELELNKNKSNEDWEAFEHGEGLNLSNQLKGYELAEKKVKKVLKMIDLQIDTSEIWKNPENDDGYFAGDINGLEAAKNIIIKEFGDLEDEKN